MKKTSKFLLFAGAGAILGAASVATVKLIQQKKKTLNEDMEVENENSIDEQISEIDAVSETASYPYLTEEDMIHLNAVGESEFTKVEQYEVTAEKAIQHTVAFTCIDDLDTFKNIVINEGFVVTTGENENELLVLNISLMDSDLILSKIFHLANLAKQYNGSYINWIVK